MLDLCAARKSCSSDSIFVSVHECTQALLLRFIASRVQLLLRKRHPTALANALRREDFDQVRACFFLLPHERANFIRRAGLLTSPQQRLDCRQDAWARECAFRDRITQGDVGGRAYALHRSEACHQRHPRIRGR